MMQKHEPCANIFSDTADAHESRLFFKTFIVWPSIMFVSGYNVCLSLRFFKISNSGDEALCCLVISPRWIGVKTWQLAWLATKSCWVLWWKNAIHSPHSFRVTRHYLRASKGSFCFLSIQLWHITSHISLIIDVLIDENWASNRSFFRHEDQIQTLQWLTQSEAP